MGDHIRRTTEGDDRAHEGILAHTRQTHPHFHLSLGKAETRKHYGSHESSRRHGPEVTSNAQENAFCPAQRPFFDHSLLLFHCLLLQSLLLPQSLFLSQLLLFLESLSFQPAAKKNDRNSACETREGKIPEACDLCWPWPAFFSVVFGIERRVLERKPPGLLTCTRAALMSTPPSDTRRETSCQPALSALRISDLKNTKDKMRKQQDC